MYRRKGNVGHKKVALETKKPKSWCKSISAFAIAMVASWYLAWQTNPIPEFKLSFEKDKDKTFVIVEVMKGQQTPYYYEGDGQLIAFMRIGNESVPATPS